MASKTPPADTAGSAPLRMRRYHRWTARRREIFLAALSQTANVRASAARAEMSLPAAYQLKHRDPEFARAWGEALEIGWSELEMALMRQGIEGTERVETITDGATGQLKYVRTTRSFPFVCAMRLYAAHRAEVLARRAAYGGARGEAKENADADAVDRASACLDEIAARLAESERRQAQEARTQGGTLSEGALGGHEGNADAGDGADAGLDERAAPLTRRVRGRALSGGAADLGEEVGEGAAGDTKSSARGTPGPADSG